MDGGQPGLTTVPRPSVAIGSSALSCSKAAVTVPRDTARWPARAREDGTASPGCQHPPDDELAHRVRHLNRQGTIIVPVEPDGEGDGWCRAHTGPS